MIPDPQREEFLFAEAFAKPRAQRAAFLDGACQADPALRARLEALLAEHDQPDSFLDEPFNFGLIGMARIEPRVETIGQRIGRYKILEKVGEGGCGIVYVAEQTEPVRRRVALKVI